MDINRQVDGVVAEAKQKLRQMEEAVSLMIQMFSKKQPLDQLSAKRLKENPSLEDEEGDDPELDSLRTEIDKRLSTLLS